MTDNSARTRKTESSSPDSRQRHAAAACFRALLWHPVCGGSAGGLIALAVSLVADELARTGDVPRSFGVFLHHGLGGPVSAAVDGIVIGAVSALLCGLFSVPLVAFLCTKNTAAQKTMKLLLFAVLSLSVGGGTAFLLGELLAGHNIDRLFLGTLVAPIGVISSLVASAHAATTLMGRPRKQHGKRKKRSGCIRVNPEQSTE